MKVGIGSVASLKVVMQAGICGARSSVVAPIFVQQTSIQNIQSNAVATLSVFSQQVSSVFCRWIVFPIVVGVLVVKIAQYFYQQKDFALAAIK